MFSTRYLHVRSAASLCQARCPLRHDGCSHIGRHARGTRRSRRRIGRRSVEWTQPMAMGRTRSTHHARNAAAYPDGVSDSSRFCDVVGGALRSDLRRQASPGTRTSPRKSSGSHRRGFRRRLRSDAASIPAGLRKAPATELHRRRVHLFRMWTGIGDADAARPLRGNIGLSEHVAAASQSRGTRHGAKVQQESFSQSEEDDARAQTRHVA